MSLQETFRDNFIGQMKKLGLVPEVGDAAIVAKGRDAYFRLETNRESFGASHALFGTLVVILGDYQKALSGDIARKEPKPGERAKDGRLFDYYPDGGSGPAEADPGLDLEKFKALNAAIYRCGDYTYFMQKGTHDLVLKDPLSIQVLMGKAELGTVLDLLRQANFPNGWLVQRPKGLGSEKNRNLARTVSVVVTVLFILLVLAKVIFRLFLK